MIYPVLVKIRYLQGNLLGKMQSLGFDLKTESTLISLTLDVVDTSKIDTALRDLKDLVEKRDVESGRKRKKTNYLIGSPAGIRIPRI